MAVAKRDRSVEILKIRVKLIRAVRPLFEEIDFQQLHTFEQDVESEASSHVSWEEEGSPMDVYAIGNVPPDEEDAMSED